MVWTSLTFLMSGILGANRCEICDMTSWINAWFFIVLRAFMILFQQWMVSNKRRIRSIPEGHTERSWPG
jgi:hypothetical protein